MSQSQIRRGLKTNKVVQDHQDDEQEGDFVPEGTWVGLHPQDRLNGHSW
jgi:hypothetical protein